MAHRLFFEMHRLSCPAACRILVALPRIEPVSPALASRFLTIGPPGKLLGGLVWIYPIAKTLRQMFECNLFIWQVIPSNSVKE